MKKPQKVRDWRLDKKITNDLLSIKHNFNIKYIETILLKHAIELDINILSIAELSLYYFKKRKPIGKNKTGFSVFFEFTKTKSKEIYWIKRGWTKDDTKIKIEEFKFNHSTYKQRLINAGNTKKNTDNILSETYKRGVETYKNRPDYEEIRKKYGHNFFKYLKRINKNTGTYYTEIEAKEIISEIQRQNSKKRWAKHKLNPKYESLTTRIEYYLAKGLSKDDAAVALRDRQRQNGLNFFVNKYGLIIGTERFNKRNAICSIKMKEQRRKYPEKWIKSGKRYSDSSKRFFDSLINEITELKHMKIYYADNEYFICDKNKKIFFYDFFVKELNLIIEHHGIVWHPKVRSQANWKSIYGNMTSEEIYDKDKYKEKLAINNGIDIISIFEDELQTKKQTIINELHTRIKSIKNNK